MTRVDRSSKVNDVMAIRQVMLEAPSGVMSGLNAVRDLQAIGDPEAVSALTAGLQANDSFVAARAAEALAELGSTEAIPAIMVALERRGDEMPGLQRDAVQMAVVKLMKRLQAKGDSEAVSVLIGLLDPSNLMISRRAAQALAELQAREAVPALIRVLELRGSDLPVNAQLTYIRALREMPHASAIGVLTEALYRNGVQDKAARGLMELRTAEATAVLEAAVTELGWWRGRKVRRALRWKKAQGLE